MMVCFLQSKIASAHTSGMATERCGPTSCHNRSSLSEIQREEAPGDLNCDNALLRLAIKGFCGLLWHLAGFSLIPSHLSGSEQVDLPRGASRAGTSQSFRISQSFGVLGPDSWVGTLAR